MDKIFSDEYFKHGDCYSRRIDDNNRLIYSVDKRARLHIVSWRGH